MVSRQHCDCVYRAIEFTFEVDVEVSKSFSIEDLTIYINGVMLDTNWYEHCSSILSESVCNADQKCLPKYKTNDNSKFIKCEPDPINHMTSYYQIFSEVLNMLK